MRFTPLTHTHLGEGIVTLLKHLLNHALIQAWFKTVAGEVTTGLKRWPKTQCRSIPFHFTDFTDFKWRISGEMNETKGYGKEAICYLVFNHAHIQTDALP